MNKQTNDKMETTKTTFDIQRNNEIINTMVSQLGGNRFMVMTGSKPQYKETKTNNPLIAFKLVRNQSKANYLKVSYISAMDLYKMEFVKATTSKLETVKVYENIYGDQLHELFTETTGLYTSL
jgi:hypothetical protein